MCEYSHKLQQPVPSLSAELWRICRGVLGRGMAGVSTLDAADGDLVLGGAH